MFNRINIVLPEDYSKYDYSKLLVLHILPVLAKYGGSNLDCLYKDYTNIEVNFKNEDMAKKAVKELNLLLKKIGKLHPEMLSNPNNENKVNPEAKLMKTKYEKKGSNYNKCKLPSMKKTKKQKN